MRIAIVGSGYVGLVTGACLARIGHDVICIDKDARKIDALRSGIVPIFEPGLSEIILENVKLGRISFETKLDVAELNVAAVFIAVGTPPLSNGRGADLSSVFAVAREIASTARDRIVVINKSTVPVGTGDAVERIIRSQQPHLDFAVVSNPEFLKEGTAIPDFMSPDRIVVGTDNEYARSVMAEIYRPLTEQSAPLLVTSRRAAELIKYASNAFLATKICFINEIADLCEAADADVREVSMGMGLDRRIGKDFLRAGPGYGGSCFPKDSTALLATAQNYAVSLRLVETTIAANDARKRKMARLVINAMGGDLNGKSVAVLGLTFKPDTDDMRESPSIDVICALQQAGANIRAYDPEGMEQARHLLNDVTFTSSPYDCIRGADCIVLTTEWNEFRNLDIGHLAELVGTRLVIDLRNALDSQELEANGFVVHGIGRKNASRSPAQTLNVKRKNPEAKPQFNGGGVKPLPVKLSVTAAQ